MGTLNNFVDYSRRLLHELQQDGTVLLELDIGSIVVAKKAGIQEGVEDVNGKNLVLIQVLLS